MKPTSPTQAHPSPVADVGGEPSPVRDGPVATTRQDHQPAGASTTAQPPAARRTPLARLLAALRGDKYMVDAYPPVQSPPKEG
jgi:hypothetical protein